MRDKRPVDELSIAELERILAIRKREARQERLRDMGERGRRVAAADPLEMPPESVAPTQHEAAAAIQPPEPPVTYDLTGDVPRFEDELETELPPRRKPTPRPAPMSYANGAASTSRSRSRALWDRLLLAIEVVGVAGIIAVLGYGGYLIINENNKIDALEQKSAEVQQEAEAMRLTPTPRPELSLSLSDVVLPGGHYSPDQTGGEYAFNLDEVPESMRPRALAQLSAPQAERVAPVTTAYSPTRIVVDTDRVKINASIYGGDIWDQLVRGVGHYQDSGNPGEPRNMVLTAHNDIYGEIFRYIQYLNPGDEIRIQANNGQWYTYVVVDRFPVSPADTWVLEAGNQPIVTLITCHPYRVDTQRMIVVAQLVS